VDFTSAAELEWILATMSLSEKVNGLCLWMTLLSRTMLGRWTVSLVLPKPKDSSLTSFL
jgi:hypothetical protein